MPSVTAVVFMHVMKCAGTSVRSGLAVGLTGRRRGSDIFELDGPAAIRAAGGTDKDNWRFRDALLPYVLSTMHPALVVGHFRYRDRYALALPDAHLVTVLRDPLDRFISLYRYQRYKDDAYTPVSMPLAEYVASRSIHGSVYVRTFCGRDDLDPASDEAVSAAVDNLRRFAVVGRTDRLDEFARGVSKCTGREITIPRVNTSPAPRTADADGTALDDRILAEARAVCEPDYRLYDQFFAGSA
jgi:hypothetical protein